MARQPGVLDVVKALRRRPFGEWNVVYFDPSKTDREKLLKRLKENRCPEAKLVASEPQQKAGVIVHADNPTSVVGDVIVVRLELPKSGAAVKVGLPKDWSLPGGEPTTMKGPSMIEIQSPAKVKAGKYTVTVSVAQIAFDVDVELVGLVR